MLDPSRFIVRVVMIALAGAAAITLGFIIAGGYDRLLNMN